MEDDLRGDMELQQFLQDPLSKGREEEMAQLRGKPRECPVRRCEDCDRRGTIHGMFPIRVMNITPLHSISQTHALEGRRLYHCQYREHLSANYAILTRIENASGKRKPSWNAEGGGRIGLLTTCITPVRKKACASSQVTAITQPNTLLTVLSHNVWVDDFRHKVDTETRPPQPRRSVDSNPQGFSVERTVRQRQRRRVRHVLSEL